MTGLDDVFADLPECPSAEELAAVLGVQQQTVWRWLRRGVLPGRKVSNTWVVFREEVRESLVMQHKISALAVPTGIDSSSLATPDESPVATRGVIA